jgi:hypothetical protein
MSISDKQEQYMLHVKALTGRQCSIFVTLIILLSLSALIATFGLMRGYLGEDTMLHLRRENVILVCFILGILVYGICVFLAGMLAQRVQICFDSTQIEITTKMIKYTISYAELTKYFVVNNTDYSRIKFITADGITYTFYVGLCHMFHQEQQVILEKLHALDQFFADFHVETDSRKGIHTVSYTKA